MTSSAWISQRSESPTALQLVICVESACSHRILYPLRFSLHCRTQKISAIAGMAFSRLGEAAKVGVKSVADTSASVARKVQEGQIGEKLTGAVSTVTSKVTDPALLTNVQASATSFWSKATAVTSGFLSTASTFVATQLAAPGQPGAVGAAYGASGSPDTADDDFWADANVPREQQQQQQQRSSSSSASASSSSNTNGGQRRAQSSSFSNNNSSAPAPAASNAADDVDDAEWLAQQVAATASKLKISSISGSTSSTSASATSKPAQAGDGWDKGWEEEEETDAPVSAPSPAPAPAPAPTPASAPAPSTGTSSGVSDDDFFAQYGIK
jgi:hypothetical protein